MIDAVPWMRLIHAFSCSDLGILVLLGIFALSITQASEDDEPSDGPNLKNGEILSRSQSAALPDTSGKTYD
jgi:hypothetical protein